MAELVVCDTHRVRKLQRILFRRHCWALVSVLFAPSTQQEGVFHCKQEVDAKRRVVKGPYQANAGMEWCDVDLGQDLIRR